MNNVKIICPYLNDEEIKIHKQTTWNLPIYYEKDEGMIGSDMMYQKMWNMFPNDDIFIMHADMFKFDEDDFENQWFDNLIEYVNKYPEAGMFGCLLLYPAIDKENRHYIQSAGGKFTEEGNPDHFGSGLILENGKMFKTELEVNTGQYDKVREVAWTTFGGLYIRREVLNQIGNFNVEYEWTYNRDVDYCLRAREKGWKIYQVPVKLLHHESRDNKRIKATNPEKAQAEMRNLATLKKLWKNSEFYATIDKEISSV